MRAIFHPAALEEMDKAAAYYDERVAGLGDDFLVRVQASVERIEENPRQFPVTRHSARRAQIGRFPYGLVYLIRNDHIWIIAAMHLQRRPGYWKDRLK
jgi:hypothetical protein